ncbi:L-xylulose reductase [Orchesella cincta]|uniref:L-xylulose reductase n=1 Tax=Orchesella cincta TaxID=48709 RepID=A0A1D2M2F5_ORCCI|nr:L-xylulose reductase [Orchesella cincta]
MVVLVTGAGRGIGRAIVGKLHAQGAIVYALSKNPDNLKKLKEEFSNVIPICVDLANTEAIKTALEPIETVDCVITTLEFYEPPNS